MKELSAGVLISWQIAAIETGFARHQFIEKEQIIIGMCSLEKVLTSRRFGMTFNDIDRREIEFENKLIKTLLSKFKLTSTSLRRELRKNYSQGNYKHTEKIVHRSEACKAFFTRAESLAENCVKVRCLHLFAAILESPKDVIEEILKKRDIRINEMLEKALFLARINQNNKNDSYII